MTNPTIQVWLVISGFTLGATTLALFVVRPMLRRRGMFDTPNHRSSHSVPTLRGGGVGILFGLFAGWVGAMLIAGGAAVHSELGPLIVTFVVVCLFGIVGWCEDCIELSVSSRLISQCAIAVVAAVGFAWTTPASGIVIGLAVPAIVVYVNMANFMDGINGISAQHGVVVAAYFAIIAYRDGETLQALAACVLASAFLSFFPWNVGRAVMFLGDSGSYVLGAAAAVLAIWTMTRHSNILVVVAPLLIYAVDVGVTLVRRVLKRASLFTAHREHVYQRLQQLTASHSRAALLVTILTGLCCALGLLAAVQPTLRPVCYVGAVAVIGLYLAMPAWIPRLPTTTRRRPSLVSPAPNEFSGLGSPPGSR